MQQAVRSTRRPRRGDLAARRPTLAPRPCTARGAAQQPAHCTRRPAEQPAEARAEREPPRGRRKRRRRRRRGQRPESGPAGCRLPLCGPRRHLLHQPRRARHAARPPQPLRAAARRRPARWRPPDLEQLLAHLRRVLRGRRGLPARGGERPVHLEPDAEVNGLAGVHDLVAEAGADHDRRAVRQRLGEAVLAAVRQEEVHPGPQNVNLRHRRSADRVGRRGEDPERRGLRPQGDHQQRALAPAGRAEGAEEAAPGGLAELPAGEAALQAVRALGARVPAEAGHVPSEHGAHARQHDPPARGARLADLREHLGGGGARVARRQLLALRAGSRPVPGHAARARRVQQGPHEGEAGAVCLVRPGQLGRHGVLQVLGRRHQVHGSEPHAVVLAEGHREPRLQAEAVPLVEAAHRRCIGLHGVHPALEGVDAQPLLRQYGLESCGQSSRTRYGVQRRRRDADHLGGEHRFWAAQGAVHHSVGRQVAQESHSPWHLPLEKDVPNTREIHHLKLEAQLMEQIAKDLHDVHLRRNSKHLGQVLHGRVPRGPRVHDGLSELVEGQVMDGVALLHQSACQR
mmetsp:Transcript_86567/g.225878  ORF Transcript_86567/g.225878 Transcript_86567/m.225878 type:complete len:571 (+) Transcript_86567:238-1950(+)